jgi:hypothetical protein
MADDRERALAWIEGLAEPRRSQVRHLHEVILGALPGIDITMYDYGGSPVIGYGSYDYANSKGPAGRWFSVGLASRKHHISLYSMASADGGYLVESIVDRFPGATTGRSCLNITDPSRIPDASVADLARVSWEQYKDGFQRPPR